MRKGMWVLAGAVLLLLALTPAVAWNKQRVATTGGGEAQTEQPPVLESLAGTLEKTSDDYALSGTEVDFGAEWYITRTAASADYNGDGAIGTIAAEVDGLVGASVTLDGEYGKKGDFDAFTINGMAYRDPQGGRPPWAGPPPWVTHNGQHASPMINK